jgi:3alpha(or 20beta)-hydroxysteroid dehydrogenase
MRLENKVALVTGAGGGLGEAIARLFASEGAQLVITDINEPAVKAVAADIGAVGLAHDVSNEEDWASVVAAAESEHGGLDILVNNAGIFDIKPLLETSTEDYMRIITINQLGCFLGMRTAIPSLKKRGGGAIVNISSTQGMLGLKGASGYVASKFAVRGMTKVAALEHGDDGIRVNSVHPGPMETPMAARVLEVDPDPSQPNPIEELPLKRIADPMEVARLVLFLASDESSYSTGSEFSADGGMQAGPRF